MPVIGKETKQPADVEAYDVGFVDWLAARSDTGLIAAVTAEVGITIDSFILVDGVVQVWVSGGTDGNKYKITVTLTTTAGRVKQDEFIVKVKET